MHFARAGRAESKAFAIAVAVGALTVWGCAPDTHARASEPARDAAAVVAGGTGDALSPRIVSLVPAASSMLVAVGADAHVVGRAFDDRTAALAERPVVGTVLAPSAERVRHLAPDLVIVRTSSPHGRLAGGETEVLPFRAERLTDVVPSVRALSAAVDEGARGEALIAAIEAELDSAAAMRVGCPRLTAVWAVSAEPPMVAGPGTLPDDLLGILGVQNTFDDAPVPWLRPSTEELALRSSAVVVWPVGGALGPFAELSDRSPWRRAASVRDGYVLEVDADLVHEAGPHVGRAAAALATGLSHLCRSTRSTPSTTPSINP